MEKMEIRELEKMVKLDLPECERAEIMKILEFLVADFKGFEQVLADGAEPLIYGVERNNVFREDVALKKASRAELLENAPEQECGYFALPMALE